MKEQGPGKGHPRKKMKLNDGEAKETNKEGETAKATEGTKINGEKDKPQAGAAEPTDTSRPTTNGVLPEPEAPAQKEIPVGTPTPKGKKRDREFEGGMNSDESLEAKKRKVANEGGMISPESLEAT